MKRADKVLVGNVDPEVVFVEKALNLVQVAHRRRVDHLQAGTETKDNGVREDIITGSDVSDARRHPLPFWYWLPLTPHPIRSGPQFHVKHCHLNGSSTFEMTLSRDVIPISSNRASLPSLFGKHTAQSIGWRQASRQ